MLTERRQEGKEEEDMLRRRGREKSGIEYSDKEEISVK